MARSPKKPKPTAQEVALGIRQEEELSSEIAKSERKFKALTRNRLGAKSLLAGSPSTGPKTAESKSSWSNAVAPKVSSPPIRRGDR